MTAPTPASDGSFDELYERHYRRLVVALTLNAGVVGEDAADIAQDAFAITYSRWERVSRGTNPAGYVYRVGFRRAFRAKRRAAAPSVGTPGAGEDRTASSAIDGVDLRQLVLDLARRERQVLTLRLIAGFDTRDTASTLGISEGTVRRALFDARRKLAEAYRAADDR